jgi:NADPH:quinone reductase-like Zn-dependent oxidoreductase
LIFGARQLHATMSLQPASDDVIRHHRQDIAEDVMRLTNKLGFDVVIEHVGEATRARSVRALALFSKQLSIPGSYMGTKGDQQRLEAFRAIRQDCS